jgi:hypothetical protein
MQQLFATTFESGCVPEAWKPKACYATVTDGVLHCGRVAAPEFLLPGHGWHRIRVETLIEPGAHSEVQFGDARCELAMGVPGKHHAARTHGAMRLATSHTDVPAIDGRRRVVFEFDRGHWRSAVDDVEVLSYQAPSETILAGLVTLTFAGDCAVHSVHIHGADEVAQPLHRYPPRKTDDFFLEMAIDIPDDMSYAPYTLDMLDELFAEYARWGVRRCHCIYEGHARRNWIRYFPDPCYTNYLKTLDNFGGEMFDTMVKAGHAHGIEMYGVFKPFEMAYMLHTFGTGTEEAETYGRFSRIGGVIRRAPEDAIEQRELMSCRKPGAHGPAANDVFTRIDLVSDRVEPAAFGVGDVQIFVSDDNNTYRVYDGPVAIGETVEDYPVYAPTGSGPRPTGAVCPSRVMRFTDLEIRSPFLALAVPGNGVTFGNALGHLVHVFGPQGEEHCVTLGIVPRAGKISYDIGTATSNDSHGLDFCRHGIEFDNVEGTPSACLTGYDGIREWFALDGRHGFIGIARGKDETTVGVASPWFEGTRRWWLGWVQEILDAGADGVELRMRHHHTHLSWIEFGFEKPLRDAFLERHGIDIWETDDFDLAAWRRLRGEAYTQFYREASALVRGSGRKLGLHISRTMDIEPERGAAMEMHFDWRTWLDENLADSVTMKEVWPRTPMAEEVLAHARPHGTPLVFSPFANNIWRQPGGAEVCANRIRQARDGGFDGFQYYENCAIVQPRPDGRIEVVHPEIVDVFQREFVR